MCEDRCVGERAEALWLWRGRETAVERKSVRIVLVYCSKYIYGKECAWLYGHRRSTKERDGAGFLPR